MTKREWLLIKQGDFVIAASGVEREVLEVMRWKTNRGTYRTCITLKKIRKSWTKSATTLYWNYDDLGKWRLKK
jgi:hypothetical protein